MTDYQVGDFVRVTSNRISTNPSYEIIEVRDDLVTVRRPGAREMTFRKGRIDRAMCFHRFSIEHRAAMAEQTEPLMEG